MRRCGWPNCASWAARWPASRPRRPRSRIAPAGSWSTWRRSTKAPTTAPAARRGSSASRRRCARAMPGATSTSSAMKGRLWCAEPTRVPHGIVWLRSNDATIRATSFTSIRTYRPKRNRARRTHIGGFPGVGGRGRVSGKKGGPTPRRPYGWRVLRLSLSTSRTTAKISSAPVSRPLGYTSRPSQGLPPMDLTPGQTIGQYRIVQKIGEGGMGAVYKADQPSIPRAVVIKVLGSAFAEAPDARDRFRRELDMITRLEHPHILPVYDYGEIDGNPYIVMRYMTGGSLQDRLQSGEWTRSEGLRLLDQVALALDFAHDRGIIHRDLKPGNVLVDDAGNAYLADFGLAKSISGTQDLTATGSTLGSPAYMSPEQARGEKLTRQSDIYAFAVLVYRMLAGRLPFEADTAWGFITAHLSEEPVPIRRYAPDLPPAVEAVLADGLAKDPLARPERATDLMASLRAGPTAGADVPPAPPAPAAPPGARGGVPP